ncbi:uncharacterized protein CTHT_0027530 [Thermochaetoides thermophila DSM 1495]|uniref:Uncharacterized protein n=1 Tax=Chaetomium thermophilum (strain DSM 1495 / CBS 144.50 / IMI 039719) TaxID=759272 RepID=G0S759_CHATD|nr:hypothetical protein CTHT_0027530 [Thermochaetoides thermophila DSM 1495]EGS20914.1 hypothetical protein CTHT_0027530 [Thermochaetoides thermophila DSM 1495]
MRALLDSVLIAGLIGLHAPNAVADSTPALINQRQNPEPGTPQYECHENCGNVISVGRTPSHCESDSWTAYYEECLDCALEFDIWRFYEAGISAIASSCGLTPTPSPADENGVSSALPTPTVTKTKFLSATHTKASEVPVTETPSTTESKSDTSQLAATSAAAQETGTDNNAASDFAKGAPLHIAAFGTIVALLGAMGLM